MTLPSAMMLLSAFTTGISPVGWAVAAAGLWPPQPASTRAEMINNKKPVERNIRKFMATLLTPIYSYARISRTVRRTALRAGKMLANADRKITISTHMISPLGEKA